MRPDLPHKVGSGRAGKIALCLLVWGTTQFVLSSDDARIQIAIRDNQIQIGTDVTKPFYMQWRSPSRDWVNWTETTLPATNEACVWMRAIFESDDPFQWEVPTDVESVYYPVVTTVSDDTIVGWTPVGALNANGSLSLIPSVDVMSSEIASVATNTAPSDTTRNNQATATPDPGTRHIFWRASTDGKVYWWNMTTGGVRKGWSEAVPYNLSAYDFIAYGDVNKDGIQDIMWRSQSDGKVYTWFLDQIGTRVSWAESVPYNLNGYERIAYGDINKDGVMDVMWRNKTDGKVYTWFLDTNGVRQSWAESVPYNLNAYEVIMFGDINKDGILDIMWRSKSDGKVYVWFLNTGGTRESWSEAVPYNLNGYDFIASGDINKDGVPDIMWRNKTDGKVYTWFLDTNGVRQSWALSVPYNLNGFDRVAYGDINSDGITDVMWRSKTDGKVYTWFLDTNGVRASWAESVPYNLSSFASFAFSD